MIKNMLLFQKHIAYTTCGVEAQALRADDKLDGVIQSYGLEQAEANTICQEAFSNDEIDNLLKMQPGDARKFLATGISKAVKAPTFSTGVKKITGKLKK